MLGNAKSFDTWKNSNFNTPSRLLNNLASEAIVTKLVYFVRKQLFFWIKKGNSNVVQTHKL